MTKALETRFRADAPRTASAETIILPLLLSVEQPTYQAAVREARVAIEKLLAELPQFGTKQAVLQMGDLARPQVQATPKLILEQVSREGVRMVLDFFLVLTIQQGRFWDRAEIIGQAIDFVQRFCNTSLDKHCLLQLQTARFWDEGQPVAELLGR